MTPDTESRIQTLLEEAEKCRAVGLTTMIIMIPRNRYTGGPTVLHLRPRMTGVVVGGKGEEYFVSVSTQDVLTHARSLVETVGARVQSAAEKIKV